MSTILRPTRSRVLVVERDEIIGTDLIEALDEAGCEAVGPFATSADALAWLEGETPDAAILDLTLEKPLQSAKVVKMPIAHKTGTVKLLKKGDFLMLEWDVADWIALALLSGSTIPFILALLLFLLFP
jgi:CheY-like chemotaxis protein